MDPSPQTVPDAVLGDSGDPGPMVDRHLPASEAASGNEDRQEPMESVEWEDPVEALPTKRPQGTAGVGEVGTKRGLAGRTGDAGGDLADQRVLSVHAVTADEINLSQEGQHPRQLCGIVLEIAIEGAEQGSRAAGDAGPDRRALAAVLGMAQSPHPRVRPLRLGDSSPGVIGAGIVHQYDLPRPRLGDEDPNQFVNERLDVVRLVEERDDDGDFSRHWRHVMGFPCRG